MIEVSTLCTQEHEQACVDLMATSDPWLTLGLKRDALLRTVRAAGRERYVAQVEGRFAGFVLLHLEGVFAGYIQTIAIVPEMRGTGCGAELVGFAEQRIFRDYANVFLCVSAFNTGARKFYARLGYSEVGELTDFLVAGHSEWLLRKTRGPIVARRI